MRAALLILILALAGPAHAGGAWRAEFFSVTDGDSYVMMITGREGRPGLEKTAVRLQGVDCPEWNQPWGKQATEFVRGLKGLPVKLSIDGGRSYNRYVGRITLADGRDLGLVLIEQGLAWWSQKFAPLAMDYAAAMTAAHAARRGLWSQAKPVPPWEWRSRRKRRGKKGGK